MSERSYHGATSRSRLNEISTLAYTRISYLNLNNKFFSSPVGERDGGRCPGSRREHGYLQTGVLRRVRRHGRHGGVPGAGLRLRHQHVLLVVRQAALRDRDRRRAMHGPGAHAAELPALPDRLQLPQ